MEKAKQELLAQAQKANNVLVTVSRNPSLDQLAAGIGLTLLLNQMGKHATAVFSGQVPSSIEYLKPDATYEKNTDSLRDFIISLDKAKADKLRYKVEEKVVKIFITPYRTSLNESDLVFSQGDFNVDLVIAIGVHEQKDLDEAIISHGRILHDATVSSVNTANSSQLGTIDWVDTRASSLCEMAYGLAVELKKDALDAQIATALLTGIVAETKRFSNEKTSAQTLEVSSQLLAAGANQQLVAAKLEQPPKDEPPEEPAGGPAKPDSPDLGGGSDAAKDDQGTLSIKHQDGGKPESKPEEPPKAEMPAAPEEEIDAEHANLEQINIDDRGYLIRPGVPLPSPANDFKPATDYTGALNSTATATPPPMADPSLEPSAGTTRELPKITTMHKSSPTVQPPAPEPAIPADDPAKLQISSDQTLHEIEQTVDSPHLGQDSDKPDDDTTLDLPTPEPPTPEPPTPEPAAEPIMPIEPLQPGTMPVPAQPDLNTARNAVQDAVNSGPNNGPLPPRVDLNANPGLIIDHTPVQPPNAAPIDQSAGPGQSAAPPLPPPLMPTDFSNGQQNSPGN